MKWASLVRWQRQSLHTAIRLRQGYAGTSPADNWARPAVTPYLVGMRVKLREGLNPDELPAGRSDAPMPLRSPGKRPELSLQARGAKHGAELRGAS